MSARRRFKPSDSLELLLDTMCNTFGGIVFIAVLVCLLSHEDKIGEIKRMLDSATQRAWARKVAAAEENAQMAEKDRAEMAVKLHAEQIEQRKTLQSQLLEAQNEARAAQDESAKQKHALAKDALAALAADPGLEAQPLLEKLATAEQRLEAARARLREEKARNQEAAQDLRVTQERIQRETERQTRILRLPKEWRTSKMRVYVALRYGKLFLIHPSPDTTEYYAPHVRATPSDLIVNVELIPHAGLNPRTQMRAIMDLLGRFSSSHYYFAFLVFPDSFGTYLAIKPAVVAGGYDQGWDPALEKPVLTFGPAGRDPPPQ